MQPELDRRFGWRWLIPHGRGPLAIVGFTDQEAAILGGVLRTKSGTPDPWTGGTIVINADAVSEVSSGLSDRVRRANVVVLVGRRSGLADWKRHLVGCEVRDYGLVPAKDPRVTVPLERGSWTSQALALHRPGRPVARAAVWFASQLARLGIAGPLFTHRLQIASREQHHAPRDDAGAWLARPSLVRGEDYAVYLGTPETSRKTVVLPLGARDEDRVVKIGQTAQARELVAREAANLTWLANTTLAARVPRVLDYGETEDGIVLHLEYRRRRAVRKARLRAAVVPFLSELGATDSDEVRLTEWLGRAKVLSNRHEVSRLDAVIERVASRGAMLRLQRTHGDFTPWNCSWTDKGFFVFDWEESQPHQVASSDAFSYVLAPASLIRGYANPRAAVAEALRFARVVAGSRSTSTAQTTIQLAAWLMLRRAKHPTPLLNALIEETVEQLR